MSLPNRIADVVTANTRIVLVVLLLTTALVGAGMPMVDDDSSLDQFESDSPEGEALEDIEENFTVEEDDNTTTLQLIHRADGDDENVLSQESLLRSLEFQQHLQNESDTNDSFDGLFADEDPFSGVENVVAITALALEDATELEEDAAELEQREAELEQRGDELEEDAAELEQREAELEEQRTELEEQRAELEQREADLDARTGILEEGFNETLELQRDYVDEQQAWFGDPEEVEAEIDATVESAIGEAELDDQQAAEYEERIEDAREIEGARYQIEQNDDNPEQNEDYQELTETLEQVRTGATLGVFESEYEELEQDAADLEQEGEQLEQEGEQLEQEGQQLEQERQELEEDAAALEEDAAALEEREQELGDEEDDSTLAEQIEAIEGLDDDEFEDVLEQALGDGDGDNDALALMPTSYEPGSTEADARMTIISQEVGDGEIEMGAATGDIADSQLQIQEYAQDHEDEMFAFGMGVITDEIDRSMADSLGIVGPLALLFVVAALFVAYRDPIDIVLGVVGIGAVLVWTFGFMGWTGIAFNQMMIAVPVLLIGLSIDYAIHVFMRHREQRESFLARKSRDGPAANDGDDSGTVRGSMTVALAGVGVALVWVTATTAIGFLANLISPIAPIQEFGIVSSVGILSALIVFGGLIPAAKIEIDTWLESRGYDRHRRAFGTGDSRFGDVLNVGAVAARKAPMVVLVVVLLLTAGGVLGATQVDTSFEEEDFLADSPPEWTEHLPGGMSPGEYQAADNLDFVSENFQRQDTQSQILIEGDVTDDETLQRVDEARSDAGESDAVFELPNGDPDVQDPLSVMEDTAAQNESFNESFHAADTEGDGVPDQNLEALYDELFEVNEEGAAQVIDRDDDGEYGGLLLTVGADGTAEFDEVADEMRAIAGTLDAEGAGDERTAAAGAGSLSAIATGDPIVNHVVEQDLLDTVLQSLMITLVAVFVFLTVAYRLTGNSASLGAVTLLPVAFTVSWILGTMYLIGMPFNVLTGMITSLTIGLGVAYSIHISARYTLELDRQGNVWDALETTVTGTGGALLGSAATTIGGFGTLAFAILPALQQFGIITGLTIAYAFLASVIVLPTLLVLWTRYFVSDATFDDEAAQPMPAASDGGYEPDAETGDGPEDERQ